MSTAGRSGDQSVVSSARVEDERTELLRRKISLWPYVKYRRVFIKDTAESIGTDGKSYQNPQKPGAQP
jgi:hypothetical protein